MNKSWGDEIHEAFVTTPDHRNRLAGCAGMGVGTAAGGSEVEWEWEMYIDRTHMNYSVCHSIAMILYIQT